MKILAGQLQEFKSVTCLFNTTTNQAPYETIPMFQSANTFCAAKLTKIYCIRAKQNK